VPLADLLNHHPSKGVALDIRDKTGVIKSQHTYKKGNEFFDKYYLNKVDSDSMYLFTYGFLFNENEVSTFEVLFNYELAKLDKVKEILKKERCGSERDTFTDNMDHFPYHFMWCLRILSLDDHWNEDINADNYEEYFSEEVEKRAMEWLSRYVNDELQKFKNRNVDKDKQFLENSANTLTHNMKNIVKMRISEKTVLGRARELLDGNPRNTCRIGPVSSKEGEIPSTEIN